MKIEVICNKCGTFLEIKKHYESPLSMGTEGYIKRLVVEPCPKCLNGALNFFRKPDMVDSSKPIL